MPTIVDPNSPSTLPGSAATAPIPKLALAATSTLAVPLLANPGGSLPAVTFTVKTTGGVAPIEFSIVGGTSAAMFELPASQSLIGQNAATLAASQIKNPLAEKSAGTVEQAVRFKGAPSIAALPTTLTVQVKALDGHGKSVTTTVAVYPYAPRVQQTTGIKSAFETQNVHFALQGFGAATAARIDSISGCAIDINREVSYGSDPAVVNGELGIDRSAMFDTIAGNCGDLHIVLAARFPGMSQFAPALTVNVPLFSFVPVKHYVFSNTWDVRKLFSFHTLQSLVGTCSGESTGTSTHTVGIVESDNDIAMVIRSGPLGTECLFGSSAITLPDGFRLAAISFVDEGSAGNSPTPVIGAEKDQCRIGGNGGTVKGPVSFEFTRGMAEVRAGDESVDELTIQGWNRPLTTSDGVTLYATQDFRYTTVILPLYAKLICAITPTNTEFVRMRVNRVEFVGPPGVTFP